FFWSSAARRTTTQDGYPPLPSRRRSRMSAIPTITRRQRSANWRAMLWTAPALAFYAVFALVPLLVAVYLSFVRWDGISQATWVGLKNWAGLFSDPVTGHAIVLTIEIMVLSWLLETPLSLLIGVFLAGPQRYRALLGIFYFVPLLFSTVAIG